MTQPAIHPDPLVTWREEFSIVQKTSYLVSHSLGAMPRSAGRALQEFSTMWDQHGVRAWEEGWWEMPVTVGNALAEILHAPKNSISMHLNVTLAQAILLSSISWKGARNRLVCSELDFPSLLYLYDGLREQGAEIIRVPSEDGLTLDAERLAKAVDDRTAVVAFSHVLYRSGAQVDVEPVVERARRHGAITLLDAYQSVGTVPIDVQALGVDVLTGGSVKWLCGGPGAGYLYVRPESAADLRPRITGWMAHPDPFSFSTDPSEPVAGGFRYLNGTPGVPALFAAQASYEILEKVGVAQVRARSVSLTERLFEAADQNGWPVHTPREAARRGATVTMGIPNAGRVCEQLEQRGVLVDFRPQVGLRLGPHFYNNEEDIDRAVSEIRDITRGS